MRKVPIMMLAIVISALALSGCQTCPKSTNLITTECVIETQEPNVIVEVRLDDNLIFVGKTHKEEQEKASFEKCTFASWLGAHQIAITAAGHEPWDKEITLIIGSKFWAKLKTK